MKRLLLVCAVIAAGAWTVVGQNSSGVATFSAIPEPENHTIVVARLLLYHDSGEYESEIRQVVNVAGDYLRRRAAAASQGEKLAAVLDIDETSLSNWEAMAGCGFCAYSAQQKLYPNATAVVISPSLELFNLGKSKGVAVFFVTGRREAERATTEQSLKTAGYSGWAGLIMRPNDDKEPARVFKPRMRQGIESQGYHIVLNLGDQASDLAGCCAERVFKLPNPFYLIP